MFHGGRAGAGIPSPKLCITVIRTLLVPSGLGPPKICPRNHCMRFQTVNPDCPMSSPFRYEKRTFTMQKPGQFRASCLK